MAFDTINIGAAPNDGTGDTLRTGGGKINDNFAKAVEGPASATAAAVAAFDGTTGKLLQDGESLQVTAGKFSPTADTVAGNGMYLPAANTLAFSTNGTERVRVDSAGRVGINTGSTALGNVFESHVNSSDTGLNTSANYAVRLRNLNSTNNTLVGLDFATNQGTGALISSVFPTASTNANAELVFSTRVGGTLAERVRINTAGAIQLPSGSPGIVFNAGSGGTSKALNDYEEGTWTPAVTFGGNSAGITYSSRTGNYIKIGKLVVASFEFFMSNKGSSTGLAAVSLPFTAANISRIGAVGAYFVVNFSGVAHPDIGMEANTNAATASIVNVATGNTLSNTAFTNTSRIIATISYRAS